MQSGSISYSVYGRYLSKVGLTISIITIIGFVGSRTLDILSGVWLTEWSEDEADDTPEHYTNRMNRLLIYAASGLFRGVFSFIGIAALANRTITAARKLHNVMLQAVIKAPMSFFDATP